MNADDFIKKYLELLEGPFEGLNLTRIEDFDSFKIKQYEDSVLPVNLNMFNPIDYSEVVDVGFGGGFPILPLAHLVPRGTFLGIETRNKKVTAVSEIAKELQLKNIKLKHARVEKFRPKENSLIISKAVGPVDRVLNWLQRYSKKNQRVAFYKGKNFLEKEEKAIKTISSKWSTIINKQYQLSNGDDRYFFMVEKRQ
jgi:16S rRNA (guanine527-N7)-methyltransferase